MIKVMHIAQSAGGVERYLYMLLSNIDQSQCENILVCSNDYSVDKFQNITAAIEKVDMCREISLKKDLKAAGQVKKLIKKYKPDIVYMHSSKAGMIGRLAAWNKKIKKVYNPHGWAFNMVSSGKKRIVYRMAEKIMAPFCNKIIAISDFEKNLH